MFYDFPQTRTERSLIQLKLKVTTRKSTGSYIYFLNAALHHSILKVSMCTIKYYWCMANPSKPNFHDWRDPSESLACFALTQVIAEALQLEIVPGGAGSWFFFFPYHLALQLSPCKYQAARRYVSTVLYLAALLWDQSFVAEHHLPSCPACKCCQTHSIATTMSLIVFIAL